MLHSDRRGEKAKDSDDSLSGAQEEIKSGVIPAEEIYQTISTLGCDWNTLVVAHVQGVSLRDIGRSSLVA